jgi:hypothetical protein
MHHSVRRVLPVIVLTASTVATGGTGQLNLEPPATPIEIAVKDAYAREFGELIERPAIHSDPLSGGCKGREPHVMTTAYFRRSSTTARLLYLFATPDGRTVIRKSQVASVVIPAGRFRVLAVIVRHPATVRDSDLANWEAAQVKINEDHGTFAASRGLSEPIVSFENTNVLVDPGDIANPSSPVSVRDAAERRGFATASYQFVASINLDPGRPAGGFAGSDGFVYMGNYSRWVQPLTAAEWVNVANAVYHHEVAHHWGWPASHDWAPRCGRRAADQPFIVPAILFGWEDVDGDRIPEILDATPYGRR